MKVAGYIERKSMLYQTGVEYGDYTMNHVLGCSHGCKYPCYAFLLKKRFGQVKTYEEWCRPFLVSNTLELLEKEIPKLKDKIQSVQLCFTTDPFMYDYPEIQQMSIASIRRLNVDQIKCCVLTKGLLPIELKDFYHENEYGITLISLDEEYREKYKAGRWTGLEFKPLTPAQFTGLAAFDMGNLYLETEPTRALRWYRLAGDLFPEYPGISENQKIAKSRLPDKF